MCANRPVDPLTPWQDKQGINNTALARKIGCDKSVITRAKKAQSLPRRETLDLIEEETGVTPNDWHDYHKRLQVYWDNRRKAKAKGPKRKEKCKC